MARARTIKPAFFKNEGLSECPFETRLLFIGLWTLADADGRLEYRPKRIKAELFPFDAVDIHGSVVLLHGKKFLVLYESGEEQFIQITNFKRHQRPHPKEPKSGWPQPPEIVPTYDKAVEKNGEPCKETASCAFPSFNPLILQSSNPTPAPSVTESVKGFKKPTTDEVKAYCDERANSIDPEAFIDFYESNGWKVGKNAMKNWRAAVRTWEHGRPKDARRGKPTPQERLEQIFNERDGVQNIF